MRAFQRLYDRGIIFAPDFVELDKCFEIIGKCREYFSAVKLGNLTLYQHGIKAVRELKEQFDIPIICDFKLMDIPDIAERVLGLGAENGMDGAMIWGLAGEETISRCIASFPEIMIFVLTEYTHSPEAISRKVGDQMAHMAAELGAYGIQAPATRPRRVEELRDIIGEELKIISCGVGHQGTPYGHAVKHGADFEIIGRSICFSQNPAAESEKAFNAILLAQATTP
ncbi:MAG: orotidine-5'-phosphate decarboxylase [Deltaproteobacteria bacterium]|nr:orotidine-5'-phosphate decarboxylase [Deltaproteobacteria bacterium]